MEPAVVAREFGPLISSLAHQFFGSHEAARDAAQEAWIEIVRDLPSFRGESSLKSWVYAVAWRRMLRFKKEEKRYSLRVLRHRYGQHETAGPSSLGPEARLWAEEACRRCMTGVLFCLSADQRLAFLFRYTAQLSFEEIAAILETTGVNVRKLYSRARTVLSRFISSECAYPSPGARCSYGVDRWTEPTGLNEAFARLGSFGSKVAAYRIHPHLMPGPNYWETFIGAESLSQKDPGLP